MSDVAENLVNNSNCRCIAIVAAVNPRLIDAQLPSHDDHLPRITVREGIELLHGLCYQGGCFVPRGLVRVSTSETLQT